MAFAVVGQSEFPPPHEAETGAERLIQDLGSPSFRVRQAATKKLRKLDAAALPALRKGAGSVDQETRQRCTLLVDQITHGAGGPTRDQLIERVPAKWVKKHVRAFLEQLARDEKFATQQHLEDALELGNFVTARATQMRRQPFVASRANLGLRLVAPTDRTYQRQTVLIPALVKAKDAAVIDCLVVTGPQPRLRAIWGSIVFVVGDLDDCTEIGNSVVVCFGDIGKVTNLRGSIVLATGRFAGFNKSCASFFEVGQLVAGHQSSNNVFVDLKQKGAIHRFEPVDGPPPGMCGDRFLGGPGPLQLFRSAERRPPRP